MRYLLLSDIHGNLEAFERILAEVKNLRIDTIIMLGDIIGYGANPSECITLARECSKTFICGNHEYAVYEPKFAECFTTHAYYAIEWTRQQLTKAEIAFIKQFKMIERFDTSTLVHGSPKEPELFDYLFTPHEADEAFRYCADRLCFIGHTHVPHIFIEGVEYGAYLQAGKSMLSRTKRYIINVGSVGQPRDMDKRLACGIFDDEEYSIEIVRLPYEAHKAAEKIRKAGLPEYLAARLL